MYCRFERTRMRTACSHRHGAEEILVSARDALPVELPEDLLAPLARELGGVAGIQQQAKDLLRQIVRVPRRRKEPRGAILDDVGDTGQIAGDDRAAASQR